MTVRLSQHGCLKINLIYEGLLLMVLSIMIKSYLTVKKKDIRKTRVLKTIPYLRPKGPKRFPQIYDQNDLKTIPQRAEINLYSPYKRVTPERGHVFPESRYVTMGIQRT